MKTQTKIPNLLILSAIVTLAFVATGCGVNTTPNNTSTTNTANPVSANNTSPTVAETTSVNTTKGNNPTGQVQNNSGSGMRGNGNGNNNGGGMMNGGQMGQGMMNQYKYNNGTYSANGEYYAEGKEVIGVSLTLQNDVVTGVSVTPQARDRNSKAYQMMFADSINSQVVGKKIADLKLSRVAGASLTTQGFNNALSIIKSQAAS